MNRPQQDEWITPRYIVDDQTERKAKQRKGWIELVAKPVSWQIAKMGRLRSVHPARLRR
jgi:hypothetical protein